MAPDPTLWDVFMGCNPNAPDAPVSDGLTIGIDSSQHHSGSNSLRVVGGDSCGYYAITTAAFTGGQIGSQVYARFFARFSGGGGADAAATPNHNGFLSMFSGPTNGNDPSFYMNYTHPPAAIAAMSGELRLGFQGGVVVWNNIIGGKDATLPDVDTMGEMQSVSPGAGPWDCYEFHIDQTTGDLEFWFNGTAVPGLTWDGTSTQGISDQWKTDGPQSLQLQSFGLGWLKVNDSETAWFDDVALAGARIGCN